MRKYTDLKDEACTEGRFGCTEGRQPAAIAGSETDFQVSSSNAKDRLGKSPQEIKLYDVFVRPDDTFASREFGLIRECNMLDCSRQTF
jgi:hypothetical protein